MSRHNPFFHKWFPTKRCMRAIECAKFLGQCTPWEQSQIRICEEPLSMKHHQAGGLGMNGMENIYESLFKASSKKKRLKMLISPDQNGERARQGVSLYPCVDVDSPVHRRLLTHSNSYDESYNSVHCSGMRKQSVRKADGWAERGSQRKQKLSCNERDRRSPSILTTLWGMADFCVVWMNERSCQTLKEVS